MLRLESADGRKLYWRWVRATSIGWILGLIGLIVLALLADLLGGGQGDSQFMVGVGIGWGVGFLQGRALAPWVPRPNRWMMASMIGMGSPFILHDVLRATAVEFPYSLPIYVLVGGLLVGFWQRNLLRPVSERANWWIPAAWMAWALPVGGIALSDWGHPGFIGGIAGLASIFFGGAVLGAVSGRALIWILGRPAD